MPTIRWRRASDRSRTMLLAALALSLSLVAPVGAQIFDSDNVVLLSRQDLYPGYNDVWGFVGNDGHEYVIQGTITGSAWWDVDDPANPVLVKFLDGAFSTWRDMFVIGDHAYLGTEGGGGIQIVDISNPVDPTVVGYYTATVNSVHNIFGDVARKLIYTAGDGPFSAGGLKVLDASNPTNLVEIGSWQNQYFHDVSAMGNRVYGSMINQGKLRILDVTNPSNPVALGSTFPDPSNHASWPFPDGIHVALAAEQSGGHIKVVDASDPFNITLVDEHNPQPNTSIHNVHVEGTRMYCSWYQRGTRIYDVSTPSAIQEIGYMDTFPDGGGLFSGNWGVYPHLPSGLIVSNDRTYGMFLMRYDPDAAVLDGAVSSSEGGAPVEGATITLSGTTQTMVTDASGAYRLTAVPGNHDILASAYGFEDAQVNVTVGAAGQLTTNFSMTKLPHGSLAGVVTDASNGQPLELVELALSGTPLTAVTGPTGAYSFPDVPTVPEAAYPLQVSLPGYGVPLLSVHIPAGGAALKDVALDPAAEYEDFADTAGWTVSNDPSLSSGEWEFGEPAGKWVNGTPLQPDQDHSIDPEDQCAVTGNTGGGPDIDDVDGGATRLLSPTYDLSSLSIPHVLYYRWYGANGGDDPWETHVTTNGGGSWTLLESTSESEAFWQPIDIDLTPITGSAPSVRFRFTCQDPAPAQIVEGALDDFTLFDVSSAVSVALPEKRGRWSLGQAFPNPFRESTRVRFSLSRREHALLSVFDVAGRRVATLVDSELEAGEHLAEWDGGLPGGARASAGVYFYRLTTPTKSDGRKVLRLR